MNQENYRFLCETLERHGLGHPAVFQALKTKMELGQTEFEIKGLKLSFGDDKVLYEPKFGQGESKGQTEAFYYLNKIKGTLVKENGESMTAEFSLYKQRGFNTREMFNLLSGRPVYRRPKGEDGRWAKVDFSSSDDNGNLKVRNYYDNTTNFSLTREIGKLPVVWADQQEKADTLQDLQTGEKVSAWIKQDGKKEQVLIGVSPQIGGLTLYNINNMEVIKHTNSQAIEMVPEMDLGAGQKQNGKLPDATKQLMDKINNPAESQEQGKKQRKVS